jgi:WD40 repeat protein
MIPFVDIDVHVQWGGDADISLDKILLTTLRPKKSLLLKKYNLDFIFGGGSDKIVRVWQKRDGVLYKSLDGHTNLISCIDSIKEGIIASGSHDRTTRVWDFHKSECLYILQDATEVCGLAVMSSNLLIAGLCTSSNYSSVWDLDSKSIKCKLGNHANTIWAVLKLSDTKVVSGSADSSIRVWDINTQEYWESKVHINWVMGLCYISENKFASCGSDGWIVIYDIKEKKSVLVLKGHSGEVSSITRLNENVIISCSKDKRLKMWDVNTGECIASVDTLHLMQGLALIDQQTIAVGLEGSIMLYSVANLEFKLIRVLHRGQGDIYWIH